MSSTTTPRTTDPQTRRTPPGHGTSTARMALPVRRTVQTRSGSRYRIEGRRVRKLRQAGGGEDFVLIDQRGGRLRYTDGTRLYISSEVIGTRTDVTG